MFHGMSITHENELVNLIKVNVRVGGCGSAIPPGLIARTEKVCGPSPTRYPVKGEAQRANGAPSNSHSNVEPKMDEVKVNFGSEYPSPGPDVIVVRGTFVTSIEVEPLLAVWVTSPG
jgi:hypothetical protein